ncbi:MAG: type II toxin-antitoxin system VapC family toxin [Candidatus Tectomicrobia bacterium]|nr:type II toxin-antitoxin system VapC family toxin [Candidatus Tectomicrobia bacterium]
MPERCVDANIAVKWFIKGEAFRYKALKLLRESRAAGIVLIAPPLFEMEADSVIQTRIVDGRTTPEVADKTLALLDTAPIVIATHPRLRQRAREIARQFHQRKVYDATYAALAELRNCEFWTADKVFYDAVKAGLAFVKYLPDYP